MTFQLRLPRFHRPALIAGTLRLALVAGLVLPVAACGGLDPLGLFGGEKYVTEIEPEVPPDTIYDQGLAHLQKGDTDGRRQGNSTMSTRTIPIRNGRERGC